MKDPQTETTHSIIGFQNSLTYEIAKRQKLFKIINSNFKIFQLAETKTPEYDLVNVQIKGYDFAILENYQSLIHKIAKFMAIDVENSWANPHQHIHVQKFANNSSNVENEYKIKLYERNVQVVDVKSHIMPLFIEAVITACPPGVKINIHEHNADIEESRYVPDYEVIELQKELEGMEQKKKKKSK